MAPPPDADATPGLLRRLAAITYDSLLLAGVLLIVGMPLPLLPEAMQKVWWLRLAIQAYLLAVCFLFFGWFWTHGGQTLGMRAWRVRVVRDDGSALGWSAAAGRFFSAMLSWAALGMGFLWIILDPAGKAWHDRLSKTRLVLLPKPNTGTRAA